MLFSDRERRALATVTYEEIRLAGMKLPAADSSYVFLRPLSRELRKFYVLVLKARSQNKPDLWPRFEEEVRAWIPESEERRFSVHAGWALMYRDAKEVSGAVSSAGSLKVFKGAFSPV